jgi:hypothetical protein
MKKGKKQSDLYTLPNLGPRSVEHLEKVGVTSIKHLQKYGPEKVYDKLCMHYKAHMHMAFLYVLRSAHSFANGKIDKAGAMRWWMFRSVKDKELVKFYKNKFKEKK